MAIIIAAASLIILSVVYRKLIQKETPDRISNMQAVLPVALGVLSAPLSFVFYMGIAYGIIYLGINTRWLPTLIRSFISATLQAGIPEEAAKLLMILLLLWLFRKKIRNVYEYVLIGGGVGFGFTVLEEFIYGSSTPTDAAGRFITLAGHMVFGMIMGKHLGLAKHNKKTGEGPVFSEYLKAIFYPMAIHVIYDAGTGNNLMLTSERDMVMLIGVIFAFAVIAVLCVLQVIVIRHFLKRSEEYCNIDV